jgi:hypothetical protein
MSRAFFFVVGAALAGVGVWLIVHEQVRNNACNAAHATLGQIGGVGETAACLNVVWYYFGGFALLAIGFISMVTAVSMMKRRRPGPRRQVEEPGPFDGWPS